MKFIRNKSFSDYIADQVVSITIGSGGGTDTDTVEDVPLAPNRAIEVELDDGSVVVLLGYTRK